MATDLNSIGRITGNRSTVDQVADRLRKAIIWGKLPPGVRLKENELALQLGVSRIPIREALTRLESEGFVKRAPYRGAEVVKLTSEQVSESFMLRELLEPFGVQLATPRLRAENITELRGIIAAIRDAVEHGHLEELIETHHEFHLAIHRCCGSAKLLSWIEELINQNHKRPPVNLAPPRLGQSADEYERIVDALEAGNADLAATLMRDHLVNSHQAQTEASRNLLAAEHELRQALQPSSP